MNREERLKKCRKEMELLGGQKRMLDEDDKKNNHRYLQVKDEIMNREIELIKLRKKEFNNKETKRAIQGEMNELCFEFEEEEKRNKNE